MGRRNAAAAALLLAAAAAAAAHEAHDAPPARAAERAALLEDGERALQRGDAEAARQAFERAGQIAHSADAEIGLVRADMQAGRYGEAVAFVAHTAGAHRQEPAGALLHAWLLALGGQADAARRRLDALTADQPSARPRAQALRALIDDDRRRPGAAWLQPPLRLAPYPSGTRPAPGSRVRGAATLLGDGRVAWAPAAALKACGASPAWLRNGLGQTTAARPSRGAAAPRGLVALATATPLPAGAETAARAPFPGSPGYLVAHVAAPDAAAAWPRLGAGFFLAPADRPDADIHLGVPAPAGAVGSPVFDANGALAGVLGASGPGGRITVVPLPPGPAPAPGRAAPPRATAEAVYDAGLRHALQLICR